VTRGEIISLDEHFAGFEKSRPLYDKVEAAVLELGEVDVRPMKSQVAFVRRRGFAWTWMSARYLTGDFAPLVLSVGLDRHDTSPRWKPPGAAECRGRRRRGTRVAAGGMGARGLGV